jgi:hypothetical protein
MLWSRTESGGISPLFLTSAIDGGEWLASRLGRFTAKGEIALAPIGSEAGWARDPVWTLRSRKKTLALAGNRISAVHPAAYRYTDRAIPDPLKENTSLVEMEGQVKALPYSLIYGRRNVI